MRVPENPLRKARRVRMFRHIKHLEDRPPSFFAVASVVLVMVIGTIDYFIYNPDLSFSIFYMLAVGGAAWFVGKRYAYFISLLSVIVSFGGDLAAGPHGS